MKHAHKNILVALVGQPNCGKSTVFSMLTGVHQHIANFPGVTVEKKQGTYEVGENRVEVIDLPGTYSLTSYSREERVARDFILLQRPEAVVVVTDASNLERHLYLAFQLREMGVPMVLCLNMMDVAERRGFRIDIPGLARLLDVPVVPTEARRGKGRDELRAAIRDVCERADHEPALWRLDYGELMEPVLQSLTDELREREHLMEDFSARWLAVKLMEDDGEARRIVLHHTHDGSGPDLLRLVDAERATLEASHKTSAARLIASQRYGLAKGIVAECVKRKRPPERTWSDRADALACNRRFGFLLVGLCLYVTFTLTFKMADEWHWIPWGSDLTQAKNWVSPTEVFTWFFETSLPSLVRDMNAGPLRSLLEDGIIRGVGGVMGFVPIIFFMFVSLAILEDSGYVARIAFVLDHFFRRFGLPGKSVLPMVIAGGIAGGCAVPGVLATRALRDRHDRLTTMLVAPFMCCGAKLPCFALLIAAFFAAHKASMLWFMAALSWALALLAALLLRRTVVRGVQAPLMLELPPYHLPTFGGVMRSAAQRSWMYMKKAGTVILAVNVLLWAMMYFPRADTTSFDARRQTAAAIADQEERAAALKAVVHAKAAAQLRGSVAGHLGHVLEPLSMLAGFDWRDNIALIGGFAAKEVVVSAMSTAYSLGETDPAEVEAAGRSHPLVQRLRADAAWSPLRAFVFMVFILVYAPCLPTVVVIGRESGSWKWALFATAYSTVLAFVLAVGIFQIGRLFGLGC